MLFDDVDDEVDLSGQSTNHSFLKEELNLAKQRLNEAIANHQQELQHLQTQAQIHLNTELE
jgi:hypothetical protein